MFNWFTDKFKSFKGYYHVFGKITVQEIEPKVYRIKSIDGVAGDSIIIQIRKLKDVLYETRDNAIDKIRNGELGKFRSLYNDYFNLKYWEIEAFNCEERLTVSREHEGNLRLAWTIDYKFTESTSPRVIIDLFRKIGEFQYVENSDWYSYVINLKQWDRFFIEAIGEHHFQVIQPIKRGLIRKQEISEGLQEHWRRVSGSGIGTVTSSIQNTTNYVERPIPYLQALELLRHQQINP